MCLPIIASKFTDAAALVLNHFAATNVSRHSRAAGVPVSQKWLERRTQLAAEHAAAGQFNSAMSLLFRQLGVVAFEPLKPHMLELYNASHAVLPGLQVRLADWLADALTDWLAG